MGEVDSKGTKRNLLITTWGHFLETLDWDWFMTLTFKRPVTNLAARNAFRRYATALEDAAGKSLAWFLVLERGSCGGLHLHVLISHVRHLDRYTWMKIWERRAGYARIYIFDPRRGAAYYCAKYLARTDCDFDLSDDRGAFRKALPDSSGAF